MCMSVDVGGGGGGVKGNQSPAAVVCCRRMSEDPGPFHAAVISGLTAMCSDRGST